MIVRQQRRGDRLSRATTKGKGTVLALYPKFVVVQLRNFRECFSYDEVRKIGAGREEAMAG